MGISLSSIFIVYQLGSVIQVFMITAIMFLSMSIYGYTTKRDLTSLGGFFLMGLFGLIAASIFNIFMQNSALDFAISIAGVVIFVGLTAYDTQQIKDIFYRTYGDDRAKAGIMGALALYLDFVNLLLHLLKLVGVKK
jgi:FtsH-binding integral membrane protein